MKFMNLELARRVEMAEAHAGASCAEALASIRPDSPVAIERIAGGIAVFAGVGSPVSQAIGVGLDGAIAEAEFDRLEDFFWSRGAGVELELCPLIDVSLYGEFAKRGYVLTEVSNVLVREISPADAFEAPTAGITVRPAPPDEGKLWTDTVAQGFAEHFPVTPVLTDAMEGFFHRRGACCFYLAFVNDKVAGGGAVAAHERVCGLFGASTLPEFRRRGVQAALLAARLRWAQEQGCDLAVSIARPASASQRNIERFGFGVAYTRTKLSREKSGG